MFRRPFLLPALLFAAGLSLAGLGRAVGLWGVAGPPGVPRGDQEIAWIHAATSGSSWERFVAGVHRKSVSLAVVSFVLAAVPLAGRVPGHALAHPGPKLTAGIVLATVGATLLVAWLARAAGPMRWLAVAIVAAVVPLVLNRPESVNTACFFFATFFAGTAF